MEQKQRSYTDYEYRNIKDRERQVIAQMLDELKDSKDKRYLFKDKHVVTDIKDALKSVNGIINGVKDLIRMFKRWQPHLSEEQVALLFCYYSL